MTELDVVSLSWIAWIPFTIYYFSGIPQILLNYKNRSTAGLSYRMVFFDYTGAMTTTIYSFLLGLPFACLVMEPLCMLNIGTLVFQCFYFCRVAQARRFLVASYSALHLVTLGMLVVAWWHPTEIGKAMGWISVVIQLFTQLPQVLKNKARRSVQGLSFAYVSLLGFAGVLEVIISFMLQLPIQNLLNGIRAVGYYLILCSQFYLYRIRQSK
jgi:uncharacterized protein with PQ loop repeat